MKYNDGNFNFFDLFSDEKYRARLILVLYAILIVGIIVFIRTNPNKDKLLNNDEEDKKPVVQVDDNEELQEKFVYLAQNNYEFDIKLLLGEEVYESKGKRYDEKITFDVTNNDSVITYIGDENNFKSNMNGTFEKADYPYFFINYYDINDIYKLLNKCTFSEEDNKYHISNQDLYNLGKGSFSNFSFDNNLDNTVELIEKSGKIVGINMDFTNLFNNSEVELNLVNININYTNFGFVDDFDTTF